jgi:O-antigen/teichoic acid export membrane protein
VLRRLARDATIYGGAHLIGRLVGLVLLALYARTLSPADLGSVDLTIAIASFALVAVALEIAQGVARRMSDARDEWERARLSGSALTFGAVAYALFAVAGLVLVGAFGRQVMGRSDGPWILAAGVCWVACSGMLSIAQANLRFGLQAKAYAASNLLLAATTAVAGSVLVLVARLGPSGVLWGQAIGSAAAFAVSFYSSRPRPIFGFDRTAIRRMLSFSLPLVPASVATIGMSWVDRLAIASHMTLADLGVYAVAARVAAMVGLLVVAMQLAVVPIAYTSHREVQTPGALARLVRLYLGATVAIVGGLVCIGPELVLVVAGRPYASGAPLIPTLSTAALLLGLSSALPGLAIASRTRLMASVAIMAAAVSTVANFGLVRIWGMGGAAAAVVLGASVFVTGTGVLGQREYRIPVATTPLAAAVTALIVLDLGSLLLAARPGEALMARLALFVISIVLVLGSRVLVAADLRAIASIIVGRSRERQAE